MAPVLTAILVTAVATGALAAPAPVDSAKLRASHVTIGKTQVPLYDLIDQSDQGMRWSEQNTADVGEALEAASKAVADAYGNGTMTNIEDTFKLFGGGNLERGCISHQQTTFDAVVPTLLGSSLIVKKIRIGTVLQHNAVIICPVGKDWQQSGLILDAWLTQKSALGKMVYSFKKWNSFGNRPRLLKDDE